MLYEMSRKEPLRAVKSRSLFCLLSAECITKYKHDKLTGSYATAPYFKSEALLANDVHQLLKFSSLFHFFFLSRRAGGC